MRGTRTVHGDRSCRMHLPATARPRERHCGRAPPPHISSPTSILHPVASEQRPRGHSQSKQREIKLFGKTSREYRRCFDCRAQRPTAEGAASTRPPCREHMARSSKPNSDWRDTPFSHGSNALAMHIFWGACGTLGWGAILPLLGFEPWLVPQGVSFLRHPS